MTSPPLRPVNGGNQADVNIYANTNKVIGFQRLMAMNGE